MILISPTTLEWDSTDAATLKVFLATVTGFRLLEALAAASPELLDGTHPNKTLVQSGRVAGYHEAVSILVKLTHEDPKPPNPVSQNYPDLEADEAWIEVDSKVDKSKE